MKNIPLILLFAIAITGCKQNTKKVENSETQANVAVISSTDTTIVNVYYFHGKQRCKTCIAVGDVAKETVEKAYAGNKVRFTEISTSENTNKELVEKYEVTWNALIIAKGNSFIEITKQAFATAVENPESLEALIKKEVNKKLK